MFNHRSGGDFTKLCLPSEKISAHSVGRKICCSISPTKFKPNLRAEICQTLFAICQICAPKKASHPVQGKKP